MIWLSYVALTAAPLIALAPRWLRRRSLVHEVELLNALIRPPVYTFTGSDEALRTRSAQRRATADGIRARAAQVESGSCGTDVLRMVRR